MLILPSVFVVALVAVVFRFTQVHDRQQHAWQEERRELLERIQRPDRLPFPAAQRPREPREEVPDEFDLVGTIDFEADA